VVYAPIAHAQNWVELPPYNTLWPLWSPTLSPVDAVTGLPTPIVTALAPDTILPEMPGLTWDPSMPYPWLLYNTLSGMAYFDPLAGINLWPAPSLLDDAGLPAPIPLPIGYADLPPTDASWLATNVPLANNSLVLAYRSFSPVLAGPAWFTAPPPLTSLLTPLDILGPVLGTPTALAPVVPVLPPATLPAPTLPIPTVIPPTAAISQLLAEQAGTWEGLWSTGLTSGPLTINLVEDPILLGTVTGFVQLVGNFVLPTLVEVTGEVLNNQVILTGSGLGIGSQIITIDLVGTLLSPTEMEGNYTLIKPGPSIREVGAFQAILTTPAIVAPAPVPTVVIPAPTVPVPTAPVPTVVAPTAPVPTVVSPTVVAPTAAISQIILPPPLVLAEQAGTWLGTWYLGFLFGDMTMILTENPLTGYLSGTVTMIGNIALGLSTPLPPIDVFGTATAGSIDVSGIDPSGLYSLSINGILISPTEMTGNWTVVKISTGLPTKNGLGTFEVTLADAVTFAPTTVAPTAIAPVPTGVVPTAIAPVPTVPVVPPPVPTVPVPTVPVVLPPVPTVPLGTVPVLTPPTVPIPTVPVPTTPVPVIPAPTVPVPTAPVATPITATIPAPIPLAPTGVLIPPTAVISGLILF